MLLTDGDPRAQIDELIRLGGMTQVELAEALEVTQPTVSRYRKGSVPGAEIERRIRSLHAKLVLRQGDTGDASRFRTTLAVIGRIVSGGADVSEVMPSEESVASDGLFEIETEFPLPSTAVAFQVEGSACWPRCRAGDIVICGPSTDGFIDPLGYDAIVKLRTGQRLFRTVRKGSGEGLFDLETHNAPLFRDVPLVSARRLLAIIPFGSWRKADRDAKTRVARHKARTK